MPYRRQLLMGLAIAIAIGIIDRAEPIWWSLLKEKVGALHTIAETSSLPRAIAVNLRRTAFGGPVYLQDCENPVIAGQYFVGLSPWTNIEKHIIGTGRAEDLFEAIYDRSSPFSELPGYVLMTEDSTLLEAVLDEPNVVIASCVRVHLLDDMDQFPPLEQKAETRLSIEIGVTHMQTGYHPETKASNSFVLKPREQHEIE